MKNQFITEYEKYKMENRLGDTVNNHSEVLTHIVRSTQLDIYNDEFLNPNNISHALVVALPAM